VENLPVGLSSPIGKKVYFRYIPGIGKVRSYDYVRNEGYVGSFDSELPKVRIKNKATVNQEESPVQSNRQTSFARLNQKSTLTSVMQPPSWDKLNAIQRTIGSKPVPQALRAEIFEARISLHQKMFY
jgi:hypothetical protein